MVAQLLLLATTIVVLWLPPIRLSLWLDETGTYWTVEDGLVTTIVRAWRFQGQSPLYYVMAWLSLGIGGRSELALRLPSTLCIATAALLLYRLGRRLAGPEAALMATVVFAAHQGVVFAAPNARPYGLAVLAAVGSVLALVWWLEDGPLVAGAAYVTLAAATVYAHYVFAPMLLVHATYALWPGEAERRVSRGAFVGALVAIIVAAIPLAPQLRALWGRRSDLSFAPMPTVLDLVRVVGPVLVMLAVVLACRARGRLSLTAPEVVLLASWGIIPPALLFLVSRDSSSSLFLVRYFLASAPGVALLAACAVRLIGSPRLRLAVTGMVVIVSFASFAGKGPQYDEDWRAASAAVRALDLPASTPVLVRSGFIEAKRLDWLEGAETASFLLAPLAFYSAGGTPIPLPWAADGAGPLYLERLAEGALAHHDRFVVMVNGSGTLLESWLASRVPRVGFEPRHLGSFGRISVVLFERRSR